MAYSFLFFPYAGLKQAVGVWVGGLSDILVRKLPPLSELRGEVRKASFEKVTGRSCWTIADKKGLKSIKNLEFGTAPLQRAR